MDDLPTLPDYLTPGLDLVSIGINPSLPAARAGFYFANPRNRFWPALNGSALVDEVLEPGCAAMQRLHAHYGIGFSDVVKRPTAGAGNLRTADFRRDAPLLRAKLEAVRPRLLWFHGKLAAGHYLRHAHGWREPLVWGEQPQPVLGARVMVTPNTSPANASYSLAVLIQWFDRVAALRRCLADASPR